MAESAEELSLDTWYETYMKSGRLGDVEEEVLDEESIEQQLEELRPSVVIKEGLCATCQSFSEAYMEECRSRFYRMFAGEDVLHVPWHAQYIHAEAASRQGCHFCRLWMHVSPTEQSRSRIPWKLESRLRKLGKSSSLTIRITFGIRTLDYPVHLRLLHPGLSGAGDVGPILALLDGFFDDIPGRHPTRSDSSSINVSRFDISELDKGNS